MQYFCVCFRVGFSSCSCCYFCFHVYFTNGKRIGHSTFLTHLINIDVRNIDAMGHVATTFTLPGNDDDIRKSFHDSPFLSCAENALSSSNMKSESRSSRQPSPLKFKAAVSLPPWRMQM